MAVELHFAAVAARSCVNADKRGLKRRGNKGKLLLSSGPVLYAYTRSTYPPRPALFAASPPNLSGGSNVGWLSPDPTSFRLTLNGRPAGLLGGGRTNDLTRSAQTRLVWEEREPRHSTRLVGDIDFASGEAGVTWHTFLPASSKVESGLFTCCRFE